MQKLKEILRETSYNSKLPKEEQDGPGNIWSVVAENSDIAL